MKNWMTKIWLPFLLLSLAAALYLEFGSVVSFNPQSRETTTVAMPSTKRGVSNKANQTQMINANRLAIGSNYASLEELADDQVSAGFVRTGYFGKHWPARVVEIAEGRDGISFVRLDGTRHTYQKFEGYTMRMIRLRSGEKETIVVFRSQEKS